MSDKLLPLRNFLREVLYAYHGRYPSNEKINTEAILKSPGKFGLRPVRKGESRLGSLMIWPKSAALVAEDGNDTNTAFSLQKIAVWYPSTKNCGALETITVDKLVSQTTSLTDIRYFQPIHPRLFWNSWIDSDDGSEQPVTLETGKLYRFRLAFSALDFNAQKNGADNPREKIELQQTEDYLPDFEPYNITVVPVGKFRTRKPLLSMVTISRDTLTRTLIQDKITTRKLNEMSREHNAIKFEDGDNTILSSAFIPIEPGCISFVVVVSSKATRRLVTSWRVNAMVGDQDATQCVTTSISRSVGPSAMPWFEVSDEKQAVARLGILDFEDFAIGSFQKARDADQDPISWVLKGPLERALRDLSEYINDNIGSDALDLKLVSRELTKTLFDCATNGDSDEDPCDGNIALQELRSLASTSKNDRVQVNLRNIVANRNYYAPVQLISYSESEALGKYLDFVQPLPIPLPPVLGPTKCISDWTSGLIVTDAAFTETWRRTLVPSIVEPLHHRSPATFDDLNLLKGYLTSSSPMCERPEALVLLAHHGRGFLADTQKRKRIEGIPAEQVSRKFKNGSVGILMACSLGAIGDKDNDGAMFLERLNEKNMRAAVISPVIVPGRLAARFLENVKTVASKLEKDTTLSEIFRLARQRILNGPDPQDNNEAVRIAANFLMIVGDPDTSICGAIK
ncbi:hypothetical protein GJ700_32320 [Duganella sp. FT92W]|uniref:CHAT domain-containing protein n=1 Tax=Pseudoduganella rivuli TaxID=2666085 RepID=A0A7X2IUL4_9BURK|nr:hypothetical protein [Pseudoduganella rivuli]MRV76407.1 hypothetical protein [Pseudoduganella rivuli]